MIIFFFFNLLFFYQIFVNCNSKQAKRTNSINQIEFLLEHCFDSCISFFIILILGSVMGLIIFEFILCYF